MMGNNIVSLLRIIIFYGLIHHPNPTRGDPRLDFIYKKCGKKHAENVSAYNDNYLKIIVSMEHNMKDVKYMKGEEGEAPNRVHVFAQCMDDLSPGECKTCFSKINTMLPGCFPSPSGFIFLDGCFMRMEDYNFFHDSESRYIIKKRCSDAKDTSVQYSKTAKTVIADLVERAPMSDGYAEAHATTYGLSVYGMANCWKTMDTWSCAACLSNASDFALDCLPAVEARALSVGCFLRYSDYEFANRLSPLVSNKDNNFLYLCFVLGAVGICLLAIIIGYFVGRSIYKRSLNHRSVLKGLAIDTFHFKYSILEKATDNFNEAHKIGQGGFGEVFKGTLPDGREMAVKRLFISGKLRIQEVCNEVDIIGRAQHKNLVRYLGCCFTNQDSLLVYEFLPNRSLDLILFDPEMKKELGWKKRLGIITGTAEGLEYLHKDCKVRIIHRDIKASNILLDFRHRPKISDFGLARFHSNDQSVTGFAIAGTLGYMAPEYLAEGRLTEKVDVYSYGVLVLEIVSGMQNNNFQSEDSLSTLVSTTWKHFLENRVSEIIDKSIEIEDIDEVTRVVQIGLLCTQESPSVRPTVTTVIQMLADKELELPTPSKPPFIVESLTISHSLASSRRSMSANSSKYSDTDHDIR